jgi:hypothetical protein
MKDYSLLLRCTLGAVLFQVGAFSAAQDVRPQAKKLPPGLHEISFDRDGKDVLSTEVLPGKFVEWCGHLASGERVAWNFRSSHALDMNVHYHQDKQVVFPAKLDAANVGADTLRVEVKQDYCWMWTNNGSLKTSLAAEVRRVQ